jgi:hypothetical protein
VTPDKIVLYVTASIQRFHEPKYEEERRKILSLLTTNLKRKSDLLNERQSRPSLLTHVFKTSITARME